MTYVVWASVSKVKMLGILDDEADCVALIESAPSRPCKRKDGGYFSCESIM